MTPSLCRRRPADSEAWGLRLQLRMDEEGEVEAEEGERAGAGARSTGE